MAGLTLKIHLSGTRGQVLGHEMGPSISSSAPANWQNYNHFTGVDYDDKTKTTAVFRVDLS